MGWAWGENVHGNSLLPQELTSQPQCSSILGVQVEVSGKSLDLGRDFLTMAFIPVALSWAVKTGACGWAAGGAVPVCPSFSPSFPLCLLQTHVFRALQDLPCFLLFSPVSPHLPELYPSKGSLFPLQELLRKVAVR